MSKLMLTDINVKNKRVLVRVDFNVPISKGYVLDDKRIRAVIPTILHLLDNGARVILISHLGRPNGIRVKKLSLKPCAKVLSDLLDREVIFIDDCIGSEVSNLVNNLGNGQVVLLENLRFYNQEIQNDIEFAQKLSEFSDVYINDAFGTMHRKHASIEAISHFIDKCTMGFLVSKELSFINTFIENQVSPVVAIFGGAKVANKIEIIDKLMPKIDCLILGGGMVFTFLKAKGFEIGDSLVEDAKITLARNLLKKFPERIVLPIDCLVTDSLSFETRSIGNSKYVRVDSIEPGWLGVDIGKETIFKFSEILSHAGTIIWNGPLGVFEIDKAAVGTVMMAKKIGEMSRNYTATIVGGGDSAMAVEKAGVLNEIFHVSTGGGAMMKLITGSVLPGISALTENV